MSKKVGSWQVVGALVAHYRKHARLTQEQFAEAASVHVDTVGSIEQVHVRDSKSIGPNFTVTPGTWAAFLGLATSPLDAVVGPQ
jgi:DNA-binding XRE family transcriptional regulator